MRYHRGGMYVLPLFRLTGTRVLISKDCSPVPCPWHAPGVLRCYVRSLCLGDMDRIIIDDINDCNF